MENIYERLRTRLDELATGYPETESKVEIRLLQRLFTEEEWMKGLPGTMKNILKRPSAVPFNLLKHPS